MYRTTRNPFHRAWSHFILSLCIALAVALPAMADHAAHKHGRPARAELGTSAAFDAQGRLWIAGKEAVEDGAFVTLQSSDNLGRTWSTPRRVQAVPEPLAAEGESRPKIAFGPRGEIHITYTTPLSKPYTGEIRFVRSADGGENFDAPLTVHANRDIITHRFDSLVVDREGRVFVAWIDKRDLEVANSRGEKYRGAAVYFAVSDDGGKSFRGDYKVADHSCECCRIALALNPEGQVVAMWRHVYGENTRDHAVAQLRADGQVARVQRATFEEWKVNACPHHGPAIAFTPDGRRHQVWFNMRGGEGAVYYGTVAVNGARTKPVKLGTSRAEHADIAIRGEQIAIVWKQFDGNDTAVRARMSDDGGRSWTEKEVARTRGNSDHPRLAAGTPGIVLAWRTLDEGMQTIVLREGAP